MQATLHMRETAQKQNVEKGNFNCMDNHREFSDKNICNKPCLKFWIQLKIYKKMDPGKKFVSNTDDSFIIR